VDHLHQMIARRIAIAMLALAAAWSPVWADSGLPFTPEENADGARFVWYVLGRSGMKFDYVPAGNFAESPDFTLVEHGLQDAGDVAWWPGMMAIYDPNFPRARELPDDVAIVTAKGPLSLTTLESERGPAVFYRYRKK
jgi:hypothetical protein